jgi:pimeloyl-ACP methyl ester carboxylesterase
MIHQKTIIINGKSLSLTTSGNGDNTIIFLHGASMSSATWLPQLRNEILQNKFQLIALDMPGHGNSERLAGPAEYSLGVLSGIVRQVVENVVSDKFILVGLSYGTTVIGEIKPPAGNCAGIMLVSPFLVNHALSPDKVLKSSPFGYVAAAENPSEMELREFINAGTIKPEVAEQFYHTYRNTDPAFRQAIGNTFNGGYTDQLGNIEEWNVPVCVVFGSGENSVRTDYLDNFPALWNGKVNMISNARHVLNEEEPDVFNSLLLKFANNVFK